MYIWLIIAMVIADQVIKNLVRSYSLGFVIFHVPGFVEFVHSQNTGAAFSMLSGHPFLVLLISTILLAGITIHVSRSMHLTRFARIAFSCLLGGGIGNLIDRVFFSHVTDYIRLLFIDFPIFNFADVLITISIAIILVLLLSNRLEEGDVHGTAH